NWLVEVTQVLPYYQCLVVSNFVSLLALISLQILPISTLRPVFSYIDAFVAR
ncbi:hypothetical protein HN873_005213, partial [Arachis hypogaea]